MSTTATAGPGPVDTSASPSALWRTLPFRSVALTEGFWSRRQEVNRTSSLLSSYRMLEAAGNLHDLQLAAGKTTGAYIGPVFMDTDVYKWLEAAAFELARRPDAEIERMADTLIDAVGEAQDEDGYVDSYWQVVEPERRWQDLAHGHELYCLGHLTQAAVAYHRATGKNKLLDIARRFADYVDSVFGPGKRAGTPGHPEVEMALVELYRDTGERRYLDLAKFFLDNHGRGLIPPGRWHGAAYYGDGAPVRDTVSVDGHAVRQLYLTSGVTDLYLETGEQALLDAQLRQWTDFTQRKMYITGGAGSRHYGEAFGEPYELTNDEAYCETCASIASVMWNWRLLLATGESRFGDVLERALYNGVLPGVSLSGDRYFYVNALRSLGEDAAFGRKFAERFEWHSCACCPPNLMRLFASLSHYVATIDSRGLQIHLFMPATIDVDLASGRRIALRMATEYPWRGAVRIEVVEADGQPWPLSLRMPAWAESASVRVNGQRVEAVPAANGYVVVERAWRRGDVVEIDLPMIPRLTEAHPRVDATRNCAAIERGPLVYCLEQVDHAPESSILDAEIDASAPLDEAWRPDLLDGVVTVGASGYATDLSAWEGLLYRPAGSPPPSRRPMRLTAVPYFAWANRGPNPMRVWIPRAPKG